MRTRRTSLLLAVLLLVFQAIAYTPSGALGRGSEIAPARVQNAIRFRSDFGLATDSVSVAASFTDPSYDDGEWGVPLSPVELQDLDARSLVRDEIQPLLELATTLPGFAGAYIDQKRGGLPVLLSTDPEELASALVGPLGVGTIYEIRGVERSLEELQGVHERIVADLPSLAKQGISVVSVGLDVPSNAVSVGGQEFSSSVARVLSDLYGTAVSVSEDAPTAWDACNSMSDCWPMKGGLRIYLTSNTTKICTSGFLAKRTDTSALVVQTAGHCLALANSTGTDYWGHRSSPSAAANFGWELANTWTANSSADVGLIQLDSDSVSALNGLAKNTLHAYDSSTNYPVSGVRSSAYQLPGDPVCRMGWGTWNATGQGRTCGLVGSNTDVTRLSCESGLTNNCKSIKHQWEVTFDSLPGDSGSPVFQQKTGYVIAYGTHVHSGSGAGAIGWYSPVAWGISAYSSSNNYSYSVCITSTC